MWQVGSEGGRRLVVRMVALVAGRRGGGRQESAYSQAQEGGGAHTPNHASAERGAQLTRVVEMKQEYETLWVEFWRRGRGLPAWI